MNIYVGNISWGLTDQDLENVFAEYGTVTSAKIITDRATGRSRGFGFVEMSDGAEAAIEALNGTEVDGRELVVNESRPKDKNDRGFR
jgi:RNA recognition motif-containing protein